MTRGRLVLMTAGTATVLGGYWAIASGQGAWAAKANEVNRWEYAELTVQEREHVAMLKTANRTVWLDVTPPYALDPTVFQKGIVRYRADYNVLFTAMNHFGNEGWEVVPGMEIKCGVAMPVRRQR